MSPFPARDQMQAGLRIAVSSGYEECVRPRNLRHDLGIAKCLSVWCRRARRVPRNQGFCRMTVRRVPADPGSSATFATQTLPRKSGSPAPSGVVKQWKEPHPNPIASDDHDSSRIEIRFEVIHIAPPATQQHSNTATQQHSKPWRPILIDQKLHALGCNGISRSATASAAKLRAAAMSSISSGGSSSTIC